MIILNHIVFPIYLFWNIGSELSYPFYHYTIYIVYLIAAACTYVYLAMCYFIPYMFLLYLLNRKTSISAFIGMILLFLFVRIWFIQPELQKLSQHD